MFAVLGAGVLSAAAALGFLGSFLYLGVATIGLVFVAAALVAQARSSPDARAPASIAVIGLALSLIGALTVTFPLVGAGLIAGAIAIVVRVAGKKARSGRVQIPRDRR